MPPDWPRSTATASRGCSTGCSTPIGPAGRVEAGLAAIEALNARLHSPKTRFKTRVAAETTAGTALDKAGAGRWIDYQIAETTEVVHRQEHRGRPGAHTRYRRVEKTGFTATATVNTTAVGYDAVTDGCFPPITNDRTMSPAEVLAAYRYQPNLERRNHILKGLVSAWSPAACSLPSPSRRPVPVRSA